MKYIITVAAVILVYVFVVWLTWPIIIFRWHCIVNRVC